MLCMSWGLISFHSLLSMQKSVLVLWSWQEELPSSLGCLPVALGYLFVFLGYLFGLLGWILVLTAALFPETSSITSPQVWWL